MRIDKFLVFKADKHLNLSHKETLSIFEAKVIKFSQEWLQGKNKFFFKTSGSTGIPKNIEITREQMLFSANATCNFLNLQENDTALLCLSPEVIGGAMMLVRAFIKKMNITAIEPNSNPLENFENAFDFLSFVPLQVYEILTKTPKKINILNKAKAIIIGGAEVNTELFERIQEITAPVYSTYGMTETVSHIALKRLNGKEKNDYFTTLEGVEINKDERGCLTIKSPVTNNETIITNDLVEILTKNTFKWLGRFDNVINTGGVKVQAEKVEKELEKVLFELIEKTLNLFVTARNDSKFGNIIIAVIESEELNKEIILKQLKKNLSKYEIPKEIYFIKEFLKTPSGKIDKLKTLASYVYFTE